MTICAGCRVEFNSVIGHSIHLRRTTNPPCRELYVQSRSYLPHLDDSDSDFFDDTSFLKPPQSPTSSNAGFKATPETVYFKGDFFGDDYREEDFNIIRDEEEELGQVLPQDSSDDDDEYDHVDSWEPPPLMAISRSPSPIGEIDDEDAEEEPGPFVGVRKEAEARFLAAPTVVTFQDAFPGSTAGAAVPVAVISPGLYNQYKRQFGSTEANIWAPFRSKLDWEIVRWAKLRGPGSTALTELLKLDNLQERLGLSFKDSPDLNKIIDSQLPSRPRFQRKEIVIGGEAYDVYFRDIIECIKALYSDPQFTQLLVFLPERHYADKDQNVRLFHDMHTGKWWWETQKNVERNTPGATIIPIILSSDKTVVTLFGNKTAYPIYLTIGSLPKEIRRKPSCHGYILIGYLPTTRLEQITNKASRRRVASNLFHACLSRIIEPLKEAGITGIHMASGDGIIRRCHPIFACYVGDYPEQLLVTLVKNGECPTCEVPHDELGANCDVRHAHQNLDKVLDALASLDEGSTIFARKCREAGVKPVVSPFWEDLPYANIYYAITPDILHELYQGVIKHLVGWIVEIYGAVEIDARCRRLPPNHNIRLFVKGISMLSRVTGHEHDQICRFILGIIIDIPLPNNRSPARLICAVRALLDFLYISQYPIHSTETLNSLDTSLQAFHDNKSIFVDLEIRSNFNIPKLHKAKHYRLAIEALGTTDNYNTEYTERLHIDLAKDAYRSTNHKDEFTQMTKWLERKEKIVYHEKFIQWRLAGEPPPADTTWHPPLYTHRPRIHMSAHPSARGVPLDRLVSDYGAMFFKPALARYIVRMNDPSLTSAPQIERRAQDLNLPFNTVSVYHGIKFWNSDAQGREATSDLLDSVHVRPERLNNRNKKVPARFDTDAIEDLHALIQETPSLYLDELRDWLALEHDLPISITSLHDNLRDLGLTFKLLRKAATERDDTLRSDWMYHVTRNFTAEQIVVLDESSKDGRTFVRHYGRALSGHSPVTRTSLDRGTRYSILPALTLEGYIAVRVVEGSIDGAEFYDFIVNDVLPCMNPFPGPRSVLMLDNCRTHKSIALREAVEVSGCVLLFLPPYSPDYSPIEESFSCLKKYLRRHYARFQGSRFPEQDILEVCFTIITPEKSRGWFRDCGYL
ncbi:hypothetical protein D9615_002285 [Tricholomella constricta]|uniref:Tc1-like transposase DDE domain-containing protein n=1 Tax=Tricholomella constricta TaxID=117010 RepID=A0A8H5M9Y4_9AGAR|nr:hypothetical protein D9615_002285 [Tricholomella constricta]